MNWSDKEKFDKAVNAERAKLKKRFDRKELSPLLLKRLEVRVVAMLDACSVKLPKPRPDGSVGEKWAILSLDDGTGQADAFAYAKCWKTYNTQANPAEPAKIEGSVDKLVLVIGEVTHRTNYEKDDVHKENPALGDVSFSVKEVYPLEEAMPQLSKGLKIARLKYEDPELREKFARLQRVAAANPGALPVSVSLEYANGTVVDVDLGPACRVAASVSLLTELAKFVPQSDVSFAPADTMSLAPREPKPWGCNETFMQSH